jgi:hypothetical protein
VYCCIKKVKRGFMSLQCRLYKTVAGSDLYRRNHNLEKTKWSHAKRQHKFLAFAIVHNTFLDINTNYGISQTVVEHPVVTP